MASVPTRRLEAEWAGLRGRTRQAGRIALKCGFFASGKAFDGAELSVFRPIAQMSGTFWPQFACKLEHFKFEMLHRLEPLKGKNTAFIIHVQAEAA